MKIAICFSGQIRTGVESSENIKKFLDDLYPNCDFFIHTWTTNQSKNYCGTRIRERETTVSEECIDKIKHIYNPVEFQIENFNEYGDIETNVSPQFYSFMKSVGLKKKHELKNNFEYDYVIKLRFDIIFSQNRKLIDDLNILNKNLKNGIYIENIDINLDENNAPFIDDVYYIGNSNVMDTFSNYFNYVNKKYYPNNTPITIYGAEIIKYLKSFNIKIFGLFGSTIDFYLLGIPKSYTIYRQECLKYSPIFEYKNCVECNSYYYDGLYPDETVQYKNRFVEDLKKKYIIEDNIHDTFVGKLYYLDELKLKDII